MFKVNVVNPEAIGVFGLCVTVWIFGVEQLGIGVDKDTDYAKLGRSLANVALYFGGFAQLFTAFCMFFFDMGIAPEARIFSGTIFATYGLFWVVVAMHFYNPGDKKVYAHFFLGIFFMTAVFAYKHIMVNGNFGALGITLLLINVLTIILPFAWYKPSPMLSKLAGAVNIAIGLAALPLMFHVLGL